MKQKFLILAYSFQGKFQADEKGSADMKMFIGISWPKPIINFSVQSNDEPQPKFAQEGPPIHAICNTLSECETILRHYKGPDALFVLPIFELDIS